MYLCYFNVTTMKKLTLNILSLHIQILAQNGHFYHKELIWYTCLSIMITEQLFQLTELTTNWSPQINLGTNKNLSISFPGVLYEFLQHIIYNWYGTQNWKISVQNCHKLEIKVVFLFLFYKWEALKVFELCSPLLINSIPVQTELISIPSSCKERLAKHRKNRTIQRHETQWGL